MIANDVEIFRKVYEKKITKDEALSLLKNLELQEMGKSNNGLSTSFPLSMNQRALWIHHQLAPESCMYNTISVFYLYKNINIDVLKRSCQNIFNRHQSLRTIIHSENNEPFQRVEQNLELPFNVTDISGFNDDEVKNIIREEARKPFDLGSGPLMRVSLFILSGKHDVILITYHHIITDAISMQIFLNELQQYYTAECSHVKFELPKLQSSYSNFVTWEHDMLSSEAGKQHREYWLEQLSGEKIQIDLPVDHPKPAIPSYRGGSVKIESSKILAQNINKVAISEKVTPFTVMVTAFSVLLYKLSKNEKIIIGTPFSGRTSSRFENNIGYFINMLPLQTRISEKIPFIDLLHTMQTTIVNTLKHSEYPFFSLAEDLRKVEQINGYSIIQVVFIFQNWLADENGHQAKEAEEKTGAYKLISHPFPLEQQEGQFQLEVEVIFINNKYEIYFKYNPDIYEPGTVERFARHYLQIINEITNNPSKKICDIELLTLKEKKQILINWNNSSSDYPREICAHDLFEEQARKKPHAVAAICKSDKISYKDLNTKSSQLASYLQKNGVKPGILVGICISRSIDMLVGLLGILKAGGAYVPLDPNYPVNRLQYMIEDTGIHMIVTQSNLRDAAGKYTDKMICLDTDWRAIEEEVVSGANRKRLPALKYRPCADDVAYVIYTSGSTGNPKGVQVLHRGLTNFLCSMAHKPGCTSADCILALTTISFDIAGLELYLPLITGGSVEIVIDDIVKNGLKLREHIENANATIIQATPATWQMLMAAGWNKKRNIKLLCGGEALSRELAEELLQRSDEVWNLYGPTETTIWSSVSKVEPGEKITIGRPIANTTLYVLDELLNPVPIGVTGELYIGGDGLALGYLNQEELTREKFIPHPFKRDSAERIYRTGDLARFESDGTLELIGRVDNQIKLRGYRIEVGEIESALKRIDDIRDSVVVMHVDKHGHKQLIAFLLTDTSNSVPDQEQIRSFLQKWIPDYMLPSRYVIVHSLPLTLNNKVNRKLLSSMEITTIERDYGLGGGRELPEIENRNIITSKVVSNIDREKNISNAAQSTANDLRDIIANIVDLNIDEIDDKRNFGEYGFDSIRFTSLSAKILEKYGLEIKPTLFYEFSSIYLLSDYMVKIYRETLEKYYPEIIKEAKSEELYCDGHFASGETRKSGLKFTTDNKSAANKIAIIGMSGKLPQSKDLEELWENIEQERDLISEVPKSRWNWEHLSVNKGKAIPYQWGGFIEDVDKFDALFFGISPREAELMDPQQRLLLETVWSSIEDAGYKPSDLSGTSTGVFIGTTGSQYGLAVSGGEISYEDHMITGFATSILSNRISYLLDLRGPSESIDTACSSSLVAMHRAITAIKCDDCDMAVVGGVNIMIDPYMTIVLGASGMLSPDGRCKTFDKSANGYVRGEGVAAIVLKDLSKAEADGDHIYAVILGSAENHGGHTNSLTAPNPAAQGALLIKAYSSAQVDPATVSYLELHGTATSLGDPIEINGIKKAFSELYKKNDKEPQSLHCGIGSIKSNMGHLEAAAGIAGVLKVLLSLKYKKIPASINVKDINPYIDLEGSPFYIVRSTREWARLRDNKGNDIPLRAGVSSFGMGGANAHVILEEYPETIKPENKIHKRLIFVLSARNEERLRDYTRRMIKFLEKQGYCEKNKHVDFFLPHLVYTLQVGREHMQERLAFIVESNEELLQQLKDFNDNITKGEGIYRGNVNNKKEMISSLLERV